MTLLDRWILAQQIGLMSFWIRSDPPNGNSAQWAAYRLKDLLSDYGLDRLYTLPPACLRLLQLAELWVGDENIPGLTKSVKTATEKLWPESGTSKGDAPLQCVEALVCVMMHSWAPAYCIVRHGLNLFGRDKDLFYKNLDSRNWKEIEKGSIVELDEALGKFRNAEMTSLERREAAVCIASLLKGVPLCNQITNALLYHCCGWPLFLAKLKGPNGGLPQLAISLPVEVDVQFGGDRSGATVVGDWALNLHCSEDPHEKTFCQWLDVAHKAAVTLWHNSINASGPLRDEVKKCQSQFNFDLASRIVGPLFGKGQRLRISDSSASAYCSQMVLARLLGRSAFIDSIVTGTIGHKDKTDYPIHYVKGVDKKLEFALDSQFSNIIVVPKTNKKEVEKLLVSRLQGSTPVDRYAEFFQTAHVIGVENLSTCADAVQATGFHKKQYIRIPQLPWAMYGHLHETTRMNPTDKQVEHVREVLKKSKESLIYLPGIGPRALASTLMYADTVVREGRGYPEDVAKPALSWTFIRVATDNEEVENDLNFWWILWHTMGAPVNMLESLSASATAPEAAKLVADALSTYRPHPGRLSYRAPDILVIVGADKLQDYWERSPTWRHRPLAPWMVLAHLKEYPMQPSPDRRSCPRLKEALSRVRIILLDGEIDDQHPRLRTVPLTSSDCAALNRLRLCRWGFTHSIASALLYDLRIRGGDVKRWLNRLSDDKDALREYHGHFHIPSWVQTELAQDALQPDELAKCHLEAAYAMAPYGNKKPTPSLPANDALQPWWWTEAVFHVHRAFRASCECIGFPYSRWASDISSLQRKIVRAASVQSWTTVRTLNVLNQREEAEKLSKYLLERYPTDRPEHLLSHAQALDLLARQKKTLKSDVVSAYEHALNAAATKDKSIIYRLEILPHYANFLARYGDDTQKRLMGDMDQEIQKLLESAPPCVVTPKWFERHGDEAEIPGDAIQYYRAGLQHVQDAPHLLFKAVGAALESYGQLPDDLDVCIEKIGRTESMARAAWGQTKGKCRRTYERIRQNRAVEEDFRVASYWRTALDYLTRRWSSMPLLSQDLNLCIRKLDSVRKT